MVQQDGLLQKLQNGKGETKMKQYDEKSTLMNFNKLTDEELKEIQGKGKHAEGFWGGAMTGAGVGAYLGPWGVVGGALGGGILGVAGTYL